MASTPPPFMQSGQPYQPLQLSQQQTMPTPAVSFPPAPPVTPTENFLLPVKPSRVKKFKQIIPFGIAFILVLAIVGIWFTSPGNAASVASPGVTQQNFGTSATNTTSSTGSGSIRVYIVGAVKNPGVYTLSIDARVYDLLQAAGGPQAKADLVAQNLAAKLTDGEEVYVTLVGEVPPTYMGGVPASNKTFTLQKAQLIFELIPQILIFMRVRKEDFNCFLRFKYHCYKFRQYTDLCVKSESGILNWKTVQVTRRIPMTRTENHIEDVVRSQETFEQLVKERLQYAVRLALVSVLEEEVAAFIGARPYERSVQRRDQRNGHYTRHARNDSWTDC